MGAGLHIMIIGTAGSGKTSICATFGKWLKRELKTKVAYINLDPGCVFTPYKPDFDIRDLFTVEKLMRKEKLGPSGAMIRAAELMEKDAEKIVSRIEKIDADLKLIDTPGQMEIFVFRPAGPRIAEALRDRATTVAVYIVDPNLALTSTGLAVAVSLSIATQLRLGIPTATVVNKADEIKVPDMDRLLTDFDYLRSKVVEEKLGAMTDLALHYVDAIKTLSKATRLVKASAKKSEGMEPLYDIVHECLCVCGDLT